MIVHRLIVNVLGHYGEEDLVMKAVTFLKRLTFLETLALSVALMAPTTGMVFVTPFLAQTAGYNVPLAFVISMIGILIIGFSFGRLGRIYAHAGSAYGLTKDVLGPKVGVLAGWGLTLTYHLLIAALLAGTGAFAQLAVSEVTGVNLPWWLYSAVAIVVVWWFAINDIRLSMRMMLILEGISMTLIVVVNALIIAHTHLSQADLVKPFIVGKTGWVGIAEALLFGLTSFLGFEGSAILGEESKDAKRMVPAAILASALVGGIFFVFVAYGQTIGFGLTPQDVQAFSTSATPMNTLAERYLNNEFSAMINVGATISFFACALAAVNGASHIMFALSRDHYLTSRMAVLHADSNTPRPAIHVATAIGVALLVTGAILFHTPTNVIGYLSGMGTFGALVAYGLVVVSSLVAYWRTDLRDNKWYGLFLPVLGLVLIGYVLYGSVYPVPPYPVNVFPYVVLAYFLVVMFLSLRHQRQSPALLDTSEPSGEVG